MYSNLSLIMLRICGTLLLFVALAPVGHLQAQPAPNYTSTVTPDQGTVGTAFTFSFDGWGDSEDYIDYWVIGPGALDNFEEGQFDNEPDAEGRTTWTWTAPPGVWNGTWTMHARGLKNYLTTSISFEIVGAPPLPGIESGVTPSSGGPGTLFRFYTDAWPKGDPVDVWVLPPNSDEPFALEKLYGAPNAEGYTTWSWEASPNVWGGTWTMNARGEYSDIFVQIPFFIDAPPPEQPYATVSPTSGAPGTPLDFFANGFEAGEEIAAWINAPGSDTPVASAGIEEVFADGDGEVRWQWTIPADAEAGAWSATLAGRDSFVEWQVAFTVLDSSGTPTGETGPFIEINPAAAPAGTTFSFTARGYGEKEQLQFWLSDPHGATLTEGEVTTRVDLSGIATWEWPSPPYTMVGEWTVHVIGTRNRIQTQATFRVTERNAEAPGGGVSQDVANPGTTLSFYAEGFRRDERVSWWVTDPRRRVYPGEVEINAGSDQRIEWTWAVPTDAAAGDWQMIAKGVESNIQRIIPFTVTHDEVAPSLPDPSPISVEVIPSVGAPGDTFTFGVTGLVSSERMGYWATDPNGIIYATEEQLIVAQDGSLEWTWTAPDDAPPGDWLMTIQSSPVDEVVSNIQVSIPFTIRQR
ncbi:MAG: hypothetical protein HC914_17585 [Chloroflexaceae bacterium]|nr:hypothetical protein [Chloroflexaceae bacterium]